MTNMENNNGCKVAFVGAGYMGREHLKAFRDIPGVELSGIWNRTKAKAEIVAAEMGIPTVSDSISDLYKRSKADLVVIAVVETAIRDVAKACFEFPWAVLMEKPPGINPADTRKIEAMANARSSRVFVALNRRFYCATRTALADLEKNSGPRFIYIQDQEDIESLGSYNFPQLVLDNWMYANCIHLVDYFAIFGRGGVKSVTRISPWDPANHSIVLAHVKFASGDTGLYSCVWNQPGPWLISINTPSKRWEFRPLEQASYQLRGERRQNPVEIADWDSKFKPGLRLQAEHAVCAALGQRSDLPTLAEAVRTVELIEKIYGYA